MRHLLILLTITLTLHASPIERDGDLLKVTHEEGVAYIHPKQVSHLNLTGNSTIHLYLTTPRTTQGTTIPNFTLNSKDKETHQRLLTYLKTIIRQNNQ